MKTNFSSKLTGKGYGHNPGTVAETWLAMRHLVQMDLKWFSLLYSARWLRCKIITYNCLH